MQAVSFVLGVENEAAFIEISDTGTGMSPETLAKIFQQGFTTKAMGAGSGLGLALSKDIMEKHQGHIAVESIEGKGSKFTIWIPIKAPDSKY